MKKAVIFLNGKENLKYEDIFEFIDGSDLFCADGGANAAYSLGVVPKMILGDMDSIKDSVKEYYGEKDVKFEIYPKEKDKSDGELLVLSILDDYDEILILNARGGRFDQEIANINILEKSSKLHIISDNEELRVLRSDFKIDNGIGKRISFISLTDSSYIRKLQGFEYNRDDFYLKRGDTLCISNEIKDEKALIEIENGTVLMIKEI